MNQISTRLAVLALMACGMVTAAVSAGNEPCPTMTLSEAPTRKTLLSLEDFTDANVSVTEGRVVLNVGLKPEAAARWKTFTADHVGTAVAFTVNGTLLKVATIKDPNLGKGLLLGPFDKAEADDLARSINAAAKDPSRCKAAHVGSYSSFWQPGPPQWPSPR